MFSATADLYDAIYSFKDYADEARKVRQVIAANCPEAKSILDIACGTGEHAKYLSAEFRVDGIDIEPAFVELARAKVPGGQFQVADMRSFQLGKHFDVVQCLFSSIGYLLTKGDIVSALTCFRSHLAPGGVVVVEPWLSPEAYKAGTVHMRTVDRPDVKVCRINTCKREGDISVMEFHYLVATNDGVRRAKEVHRMALTSPEQMESYFQAAGLGCSFDAEGLSGRGLFVARALGN
jgi:SAM-dependent methyltransferase